MCCNVRTHAVQEKGTIKKKLYYFCTILLLIFYIVRYKKLLSFDSSNACHVLLTVNQ